MPLFSYYPVVVTAYVYINVVFFAFVESRLEGLSETVSLPAKVGVSLGTLYPPLSRLFIPICLEYLVSNFVKLF